MFIDLVIVKLKIESVLIVLFNDNNSSILNIVELIEQPNEVNGFDGSGLLNTNEVIDRVKFIIKLIIRPKSAPCKNIHDNVNKDCK